MELDISRGIMWLKPESEYVYNDMMAHMLYTEYSLLQVHILKSPLISGAGKKKFEYLWHLESGLTTQPLII